MRQTSKILQQLKGSIRPVMVQASGLVGFLLLAAAFFGSLQDSLAAGG